MNFAQHVRASRTSHNLYFKAQCFEFGNVFKAEIISDKITDFGLIK